MSVFARFCRLPGISRVSISRVRGSRFSTTLTTHVAQTAGLPSLNGLAEIFGKFVSRKRGFKYNYATFHESRLSEVRRVPSDNGIVPILVRLTTCKPLFT